MEKNSYERRVYRGGRRYLTIFELYDDILGHIAQNVTGENNLGTNGIYEVIVNGNCFRTLALCLQV